MSAPPDPAPANAGAADTDHAIITAEDQAPGGVAHPRAIRSFVTRAGRTTSGQARALAQLGPRYVLPHDPDTPDLIAACAC